MVADVLEEAPVRFALADDAGDVGPQVPFVGGTQSLAGHGKRLARVAANDSRYESTPACSIEGAQVRPDRRVIQDAFSHKVRKARGRITFPLRMTNWPCTIEGEQDAEVESSDPGAEGEVRFGTYNHVTAAPPGVR